MAAIVNQMEGLTLDEESHSDDEVDTMDCRTFFRSYKENKKFFSKCLVANCRKKKLAGKQKFNLERHLTTMHNMKFVNHVPELPKREITLKIKMDPAMVYKAYVENLTVDGRPIVSVNDGGMRKLVNPILQAFEKSRVHLDVSPPKVKVYMMKYAAALKSKITKEIKNRIVHIKLDIASKNRRSILGINAQYMKNDKVVVRTLGMVQTNHSHTGEYICTLLMQTLDEYKIKYSQVHTITTDNGKNIVKSVELFGDVENQNLFESDDLSLDGFFNTSWNDGSDVEDNETDETEEENADPFELNLDSAISILRSRTGILSGLRCAAHTLQLVIHHALKNSSYSKKLIQKCRRIVKQLLKPNMINLIRQQNLKMPKIDCLTRWSSTYYMLQRLIELKAFYTSMISFMPSNCKLNESEWDNLDGIINILSLFESATKKLQAVNFTVADFFYTWHELKLELEAYSGVELVDNLLAEMESYKANVLQNGVVYSCVFMDPRYRLLLTEDEKNVAIDHLKSLWRTKQSLCAEHLDLNGADSNVDESSGALSKMEMILQEKERAMQLSASNDRGNIELKLRDYALEKRSSIDTNVFEYWTDRKSENKELYELSTITNSVPITQVTVERAFSSMAFIFNALRNSLAPETLENLLLIRLNKDTFDELPLIYDVNDSLE